MYDINIKQGATFTLSIAYKELIDGEEVVIDLTGYSALLQIRRTQESTDLILETVPSINVTTGTITITFTPAEATIIYEALKGTEGVFDLEIIKDADIIPLISGKVMPEANTIHD